MEQLLVAWRESSLGDPTVDPLNALVRQRPVQKGRKQGRFRQRQRKPASYGRHAVSGGQSGPKNLHRWGRQRGGKERGRKRGKRRRTVRFACRDKLGRIMQGDRIRRERVHGTGPDYFHRLLRGTGRVWRRFLLFTNILGVGAGRMLLGLLRFGIFGRFGRCSDGESEAGRVRGARRLSRRRRAGGGGRGNRYQRIVQLGFCGRVGGTGLVSRRDCGIFTRLATVLGLVGDPFANVSAHQALDPESFVLRGGTGVDKVNGVLFPPTGGFFRRHGSLKAHYSGGSTEGESDAHPGVRR